MEKMTFFKAVKTCFCKYCVFKGRARRAEFWYFYLFNFLISLVFTVGMMTNIVKMSLNGEMDAIDPTDTFAVFSLMGGWFYALMAWGLVTLLPSIAVSVRRLHDTGRSGWWYIGYYLVSIVLGIVPSLFLGSMSAVASGAIEAAASLILIAFFIVLIVWFATAGQPFDNKYGPNPQAEPAVVDVDFTPAAEETVADAKEAVEAVEQAVEAAEEAVAAAEEPAAEPTEADEKPAPTE